MTDKGFFILTDISGYTEFLTKSELDHARDALQNLFDVQLAQIKHPFVISGFRGDAIFMYVPENHFCDPQALLESLENLYFVFSDALRQMIYNTTCTCRACKNMSGLDLKMVVHYGEYAIQIFGDREELLGADVIVPHRMLKNHVIEQTGVSSYALFSEAAAGALRLSEYAQPLIPYSEVYEHIGEVKMQVLDLRKVWEREQEKRRFVVTPEEAWLTLEFDAPFPASIIWEYMNIPDLESKYAGYDFVERIDSIGGRIQTGTSFHCVHKGAQIVNWILDWKPFEYYTKRQLIRDTIEITQTRVFTPTDKGTKLAIRFGQPAGAPPEYRESLTSMFQNSMNTLWEIIKADIANGTIAVHGS